MKLLAALGLIFSVTTAHAEDKIKMYYNNEEIIKIIETYSKVSGQKFIIDPSVRGKISIFNQESVSLVEAFNQLSTALAINGFAISKQDDVMVVKLARNIQRDYLQVGSEVPSLKPERMYVWIYTVKTRSAGQILRDMRNLLSVNGEVASDELTNQLFFTDFTSNINRIAAMIKELDKPADDAVLKIVEATKKQKASQKEKMTNNSASSPTSQKETKKGNN